MHFFNKLPPSISSLTLGQLEAAVSVTAYRESSVLFAVKISHFIFFYVGYCPYPNVFKMKKMVGLGLMFIIALT